MHDIVPLVSVIIPVYNSSDTLRKTLESAIRQTYSNFEIIVVDDGSTDNHYSIVQDIHDSRITYFKLEEHTNANVARNHGITKSKGLYVAMLDADDLWKESHIEECIEIMSHNLCDGLYGSLIINNSLLNTQTEILVRDLHEGESMIDYLLSTGCGAQTSSLFLKSECVKTIMWDKNLTRHQDYDFVVRFSQRYKMIPKSNPTTIYNISSSPKTIDFSGCINFIKRNAHDIHPFVYYRYHLNMLKFTRSCGAPTKIIRHYKKETIKNTTLLSFVRVLQIGEPKNKIQKLGYKIAYLFSVAIKG